MWFNECLFIFNVVTGHNYEILFFFSFILVSAMKYHSKINQPLHEMAKTPPITEQEMNKENCRQLLFCVVSFPCALSTSTKRNKKKKNKKWMGIFRLEYHRVNFPIKLSFFRILLSNLNCSLCVCVLFLHF